MNDIFVYKFVSTKWTLMSPLAQRFTTYRRVFKSRLAP